MSASGHSVCPTCGGERSAGRTTFTAELGVGVVVVRQVPAQVCDQCGEAWIEDSVARRLEEIVEAARARGAEVEVVEWDRAAA